MTAPAHRRLDGLGRVLWSLMVGAGLLLLVSALSIAFQPQRLLPQVASTEDARAWVEAHIPAEVRAMPGPSPELRLDVSGWGVDRWWACEDASGALWFVDADGTPLKTLPGISVERHRVGWPLAAFEGSYWYPNATMTWTAVEVWPGDPRGAPRAWPYGLLWGGLAVDVVVLAALAWPCFALGRRSIEQRRRRRGECTRCRHPIAGADRCPECGHLAGD